MEITDQGHVNAHAIELLTDRGDLGGSFWRVDRDADGLRSRLRQFLDLDRRGDGIGSVGIGRAGGARQSIGSVG
jgi:hypothetical protein